MEIEVQDRKKRKTSGFKKLREQHAGNEILLNNNESNASSYS
jgi:hypothetical protein